MYNYAPPAYRPVRAQQQIAATRPQMGSLASMTGPDWLYLLGGAIVGGAGINGLVSQFRGPRIRPNAVSVLLNVVLTGVGLALFVDKGGKAISA